MHEQDDGFTGLEAAIILIAFVVVASVFSYMVLGTGFSAIQETQKTIHTEVQGVSSSLTIAGTIYGVSPDRVRVQALLVPIGLAAGGDGVDVSSMSVRFLSQNHYCELTPEDPLMDSKPHANRWSIQEVFNGDGDSILEDGETFKINLSPIFPGDLVADGEFTVEMKPAGGAALRIERRLPQQIDLITRIP
jgi:flagellin FlaB